MSAITWAQTTVWGDHSMTQAHWVKLDLRPCTGEVQTCHKYWNKYISILWLDHVHAGTVKFPKSWLWTLPCLQKIHHFFFSHTFSITHNAVVLWLFRCVHPKNQTKVFWFLHFYESNQMSHTQLTYRLVHHQTDLLLCTINCFIQWAHPQNMAVGDLTFFNHTLYLCSQHVDSGEMWINAN